MKKMTVGNPGVLMKKQLQGQPPDSPDLSATDLRFLTQYNHFNSRSAQKI